MRQVKEAGRVRKITRKKRARGSVMVLTAVVLLVLIGIAALAVDLGQAHMAKQRAHDVMDAAALAAAWSLEPGLTMVESLALASQAAQDVVDANNQSRKSKVENLSVTLSPDGKTVTVQAELQVNFGFAKVLGSKYQSEQISASSKAVLENIPDFKYAFVPLAVTDWQIQDIEPGRQEILRTPYWIKGGNSTTDVPGNPPNLYPVTFGGSAYDSEVYRDLLLGVAPSFSVATDSRVGSIANDIVQATYDAISTRISTRIQGEDVSDKWVDWNDDSNVKKTKSPRIVIMPVVSYYDHTKVVGFAGFFIEKLIMDDTSPIPGMPLYKTDIYGYFVPGTVGRKSIRWMKQLLSDYDQQNLMYRVRLVQ